MKKKKDSCIYCGSDLNAATTRKKFCSAKCRVYFGRELILNIKDSDEPRPDNMNNQAPKSLFNIQRADAPVKKEQTKKWSLAEQLDKIESDKKTKTK